MRLGGRGLGFGGALLGGGDPAVGLGLDLLRASSNLTLNSTSAAFWASATALSAAAFASAAACSAAARALAAWATISSRSACERCCSSSKAFSARSRAASARGHPRLGLGARLALGGDPLACLGGDLAQRHHRPLLELGP